MDRKVLGVLFGIAGIILWFMPFIYIQKFDDIFFLYQAGHHIGGLASLIFLFSLSYAIFSWFEQHQLRIITAIATTGICGLFIMQAGSQVAWGLITLFIVSIVSIIFAVSDHNKSKSKKDNTTQSTTVNN